MDPETIDLLRNQCGEMFAMFDEDNSGTVEAEELFRTLSSFGLQRSPQ